ncbi:MAG TPA: hypothetical protein VFV94_07440, partial [Polyangiaceae bacterium]|nr:hypothetical protein [Polyangiaceae bacterium]
AEPSVAPPAADTVVVPPLPAVAAPPVVLAPPSATTETAASEPLPSVALPPVATELAPTVNPVAAVSVVAAVSPIAVAHDELAGSVLQAERRDHTLMLSEVAPREPMVPLAPQLVETRPEPVVRRASQRPAPPPAPIRVAAEPGERGHTVPLPPVAPVASPEPAAPVEAFPEQETRDTPVLGTRLSAQVWPDDSTNSAELEQSELDISVIVEARPEFASAPVVETAVLEAEVLEAEVLENDDGLIEVIFEDEARAASPEDRELLVAEAAPHEANETTDPCPPVAAESVLMPEVEAAAVEPETPAPATLDADTLRPAPPAPAEAAEAAEPAVALAEPALEPPPVDLLPSDVELAALVESALPPWTTAEAPAFEVTPPPRVALPTPRRSDVEALLGRLNDAPVGVDELRSGLKHLAGLDLTPPPPGTERGE